MHAVVCGPDAEIESSLETMKAHRVHRLPVVNKAGLLEGIVSMNDIVLRAKPGRPLSTSNIATAIWW